MITDYQVGDFVSVSDGTPRPPDRHTRKLARWRLRNCTGYVYRIDPDGCVAIDETGTKTMVIIIDPRYAAITKVQEKNKEART